MLELAACGGCWSRLVPRDPVVVGREAFPSGPKMVRQQVRGREAFPPGSKVVRLPRVT